MAHSIKGCTKTEQPKTYVKDHWPLSVLCQCFDVVWSQAEICPEGHLDLENLDKQVFKWSKKSIA